MCCKCGTGADLEEGHHHCMPAFAYSDEAADTCTSMLSCTWQLLPAARVQSVLDVNASVSAKTESMRQNKSEQNGTEQNRTGQNRLRLHKVKRIERTHKTKPDRTEQNRAEQLSD